MSYLQRVIVVSLSTPSGCCPSPVMQSYLFVYPFSSHACYMMLFASNKYFELVAIYCKWLVCNAVLGRKEEAFSTIVSPISRLFCGHTMVKIIFNIVHNALTLNSKMQLSTLRYSYDHTIE